MPPLTSDQSAKLQSDMCQIVDAATPPLTAAEANQIKGSTCWAVEDVEAKSPPPSGAGGTGSNTSLTIVPLPWPSASLYVRSGEQQGQCQFKFTVAANEVPRPGQLILSTVHSTGAEDYTYQWSREPFAQFPDDALPGSRILFVVGRDQAGMHRVNPGETWYVATKCEGGDQGQKYVGDLVVNAA